METTYQKLAKAGATAALLIVTIIWGSSFVVMKNAVGQITPTYLLAYRFTIASVGLIVLFFSKFRTITKDEIRYGTLIGSFLFISYFLQTYGLLYTTASKNAFITTLYVIVVPFLHWFFNRSRPGKNNVAAALIAVIGLALISLEGDLKINLGDFLTLICGVCFAFQVVFLDRYTEKYDPVKLTIVQMVCCCVFSWCLAPLIEGPCDLSVLTAPYVTSSLLYLGLIGCMACFLAQSICQKYLNPNTTSILLSFEAVFGLIFSVIFLGERLNLKVLSGCGLMFAAMILSEYTPRTERKYGGFHKPQERIETEI